MKNLAFPAFAAVLLIVAGAGLEARGQSKQEDVRATVLSIDGKFWQAYNTCDTAAFAQFFTDDVEFYHDNGGVTLGAQALVEASTANLCSGDTRLRREALEDPVNVFPMRNGNELYGAVISGQHRFYVRKGAGPERLDGLAQFMNLWVLEDGAWKMSRVLSYDHGPAPYVNTREQITLAASGLDAFVGSYQGPDSGTMQIQRAEGCLILSVEKGKTQPLKLYPESDHVFFAVERDLTFEFVGDAGTMKMRVRERGTVVEEAVRHE